MKKFIMFGVMAVLLVVALLAFVVMPTAPLAVDDGTVAASGVTADAAGVALPEGSSLIVPAVELVQPSALATPAANYLVIALGASLLAIVVTFRRRLKSLTAMIVHLVGNNVHTSEGATTGGGPNKFILPMAA